MTTEPLVWIAIGSLLLTALAAIAAEALRRFSRSELQDLSERRQKIDRFSEVMRRHAPAALGVDLLSAIGAGIFVASIFSLTMVAPAARQSASTTVAAGAVFGAVLAVMRVGAPWALARVVGASFVFHAWPLLRVVDALAWPLRGAVLMIDKLLHRLAGKEATPQDAEDALEDEIMTIVTEGHREGLLEEDAREMIEGVIELGDATASQIMTPRTDMHMLSADLPWDELLADVVNLGHTRIPVFEGSRDEIVGMLYVKDLLPELGKPDPADRLPLRELLRRPIFVPGTKPVDDLLEQFQQERTHIALILDEYGGVAGLVTIEDILEEIVGEIVDEYDQDVEADIRPLGDGAVEAVGRAHIDEINEALDLELPEDASFDTIGGFVFAELGRVPVAGEQVSWNGAVRVTVLEATRRRIERVKVERTEPSVADSA